MLHLDWKKPLVNVITVFHIIITLGFSKGHNVVFLKINQKKYYMQTHTVSQHEASMVMSDS